MKFLIYQASVVIGGVILMLYLVSKEYFVPIQQNGDIALYNVLIMGGLLFLIVQAIGGIISMLVKKKLAFGRKEFPPAIPCLIDGFALAFGVIAIIILNIFHILSFVWGILLLLIIVVVIVLSK